MCQIRYTRTVGCTVRTYVGAISPPRAVSCLTSPSSLGLPPSTLRSGVLVLECGVWSVMWQAQQGRGVKQDLTLWSVQSLSYGWPVWRTSRMVIMNVSISYHKCTYDMYYCSTYKSTSSRSVWTPRSRGSGSAASRRRPTTFQTRASFARRGPSRCPSTIRSAPRRTCP